MIRRIVDTLVLVFVAFAGAQTMHEAPGIFRAEPLSSWRSLVAAGQVLVGIGSAIVLVAYFRRREWLRAGAILWAVGGIIAGSIATFAWDTFALSGFLGALAGTSVLAFLVVGWAVSRRSVPSHQSSPQAAHPRP